MVDYVTDIYPVVSPSLVLGFRCIRPFRTTTTTTTRRPNDGRKLRQQLGTFQANPQFGLYLAHMMAHQSQEVRRWGLEISGRDSSVW